MKPGSRAADALAARTPRAAAAVPRVVTIVGVPNDSEFDVDLAGTTVRLPRLRACQAVLGDAALVWQYGTLMFVADAFGAGGPGGTAVGIEYVLNGGFEQVDGNGFPLYWSAFWGDAGIPYVAGTSTASPIAGTRSFQISGPAPADVIDKWLSGGDENLFSVKPGERYRVEALVRSSVPVPNGVELALWTGTRAGRAQPFEPGTQISTVNVATPDVSSAAVTGVVQIPVGAEVALVALHFNSKTPNVPGATFYADAVSARRI